MLTGYLALITGIIITVAVIPLAYCSTPLVVQVFNAIISAPPYAAVIMSWAGGCCCALAYRQLTMPRLQSEKVRAEWQNQDAKLASEIQSDEVKQLKAKILTLETALSTALKKKKN